MTKKILFDFQNVRLGYGRTTVLDHVTCRVEEGDYVALVGPNGCGKTTWVKTALGVISPLGGRLEIEKKRCAYVPQIDAHNLFWPMTLEDLVNLPARSARWWGRPREEDYQKTKEALRRVSLWDIRHQLFRDSSGGQRQRAVLAQALAQNPDVYFLDEPTRGLDVLAARDFLGLVDEIHHSGKTIVLVTHTLADSLNHAKKMFIFSHGTLISTTPEEIVEHKKLDAVYGVPFDVFESHGRTWAHTEGTAP